MNRVTILLVCMLFLSLPAYTERQCTADQVYSDPLGSMGCSIELSGRVKKITGVSFPMEFIVKTGGNLFLIQYFPRADAKRIAIIEGKKYSLKGTILGSKQVLYDGSMVKLPQVYCIAIE